MREPSKKSQKTSPHPLMGYLGFQLRQATVLMQSDLSKRLAAHGLNMIEMSTLLIIEASAGVTPAQIGRMIKVARANMAPITTGLVNRGLIDAQPVDGRSIGLHLTAAGATIVEAVHAMVEENEALIMKRIPVAERAQLIEQLSRVWSDDS